ncbi:MAG TPA: 6,7-dimethyl-8-ribityllumazine synthase [Moorella mulderi]|nr:6,7-dimethyl-8-ribityllumazine synthase [Moorella mulderi]
MGEVFTGSLRAEGLRFCVIVSRFNEFITSKLLSGALDALERHGARPEDIHVVWVPGAFEIPVTAQRMASKGYDAIICLAAIIRGATPHFDFVAAEAIKGIAQVALATGLPVVNGLITADTLEQAIERAGTKMGNKGFDAALTAMEMANLFKQI